MSSQTSHRKFYRSQQNTCDCITYVCRHSHVAGAYAQLPVVCAFLTFAQDVGHVSWNAPRFGCELVMKTLGEKKQARILDAASGTGLGGKLVSDVHVPVLRYLYVSRWWQQLKDRYRVALVA